jgi:hypothetical protein
VSDLAVIIRFSGDPDVLLERFEHARQMWIEAQAPDYETPVFYAACRTDDGIAVVNIWASAMAHRRFGQGLHRYIEAAGLDAPIEIERMRIEELGWDKPALA